MNPSRPSTLDPRSFELVQARYARSLTAALSEYQLHATGPDIEARLRFARERALAAAGQARSATAIAGAVAMGPVGSAAVLGGGSDSTAWWLRLGALLPLAVLLAGLVLIDSRYTRSQIEAAAEVDAAILADDLPPEAYRDQGFVEYLKTARP